MANDDANPAGKAMKASADAGSAMGRTAADATTEMGRTAVGAADSLARTASDAAASMGQSAMGAMSQAGFQPGAMPGMAEFTKFCCDMKTASIRDREALLCSHGRNLETLTTANRVALEGAQAVARRHMEIVQQSLSELTEGMRQLSSNEPPQAKAAKQAEMMKSSYERAVANLRDLSDLIQRSNGEAVGVLNKRFTEAMDEMRSLMAKGAGP